MFRAYLCADGVCVCVCGVRGGGVTWWCARVFGGLWHDDRRVGTQAVCTPAGGRFNAVCAYVQVARQGAPGSGPRGRPLQPRKAWVAGADQPGSAANVATAGRLGSGSGPSTHRGNGVWGTGIQWTQTAVILLARVRSTGTNQGA